MTKRILIVGGVAGGASTAARLRRLDEQADIVMYERGAFVSFANCGLPYHVGGVIAEEDKLLVAKPALFADRFRIAVKARHEVVAIDRAAKSITVRDLATGQDFQDRYDALVLSPGATAIIPPIAGIDGPGIFTMRTIPDARAVKGWIAERKATRAVVIGGGFIGLEMVENLRHLGLAVTLVEKAEQVMPPIDAEMAAPVRRHLEANQVVVRLGDGATAFERQADGTITVRTEQGAALATDLVILAIGVRPDTTLAKQAGLELGSRGGIRVDAQLRTSDPAIWAVGDAVEVADAVSGGATLLALAGPANRQGRLAAASICGRAPAFRGVQGTAVVGLFGLTVASTGASVKSLVRSGSTDFAVIHLHPAHHVGYYPGAKPINLKLVFRPSDGRVLGAQAVGTEGVEKRIDVIAMAIQMGGTVEDLAEAELCYAPQFGAAKDPVNIAGMIAMNHQSGDAPIAQWSDVNEGVTLLDVREPGEWQAGHHPQAVHIPLHQLRSRSGELPRQRPVLVHCAVGLRAHNAVRILRQQGFDARNITGGWTTWKHIQDA